METLIVLFIIFLIVIATAIPVTIYIFVVRAICNYLARKTAEEIDKKNKEFWRYQCSQLATAIALKLNEVQKKEEKEPSAE